VTLHNLTARAICILVLSAVGCGKPSTPTPTAKTLHQSAIFYPDQIPTLIANGVEIEVLDTNGNSALWVAARHFKTESVRLLLAAGADPNIRGQQGWTPLHCTTFCWSASADSSRSYDGPKRAGVVPCMGRGWKSAHLTCDWPMGRFGLNGKQTSALTHISTRSTTGTTEQNKAVKPSGGSGRNQNESHLVAAG